MCTDRASLTIDKNHLGVLLWLFSSCSRYAFGTFHVHRAHNFEFLVLWMVGAVRLDLRLFVCVNLMVIQNIVWTPCKYFTSGIVVAVASAIRSIRSNFMLGHFSWFFNCDKCYLMFIYCLHFFSVSFTLSLSQKYQQETMTRQNEATRHVSGKRSAKEYMYAQIHTCTSSHAMNRMYVAKWA